MSARLFCNLFTKSLTGVRFYSRSANASNFNLTRWSLNSPRIFLVSSVEQFQVRNYAKSKDKGKNNKKGGKVEINSTQLNEVIDYDSLKVNLEGILQTLHEDNAKHLSLRTSIGSIESLKVKFGGKEHELQELAQVMRKNAKTVQLQMGAFPAAIPSVVKTLQESGLNLNPQQEGNNVYVPIPKVTKEHREHLTKNAKVLFYKCRNNMKALELNLMKEIKKIEKLPEDVAFSVRKQINALVDDYLLKARNITDTKCKELNQVE